MNESQNNSEFKKPRHFDGGGDVVGDSMNVLGGVTGSFDKVAKAYLPDQSSALIQAIKKTAKYLSTSASLYGAMAMPSMGSDLYGPDLSAMKPNVPGQVKEAEKFASWRSKDQDYHAQVNQERDIRHFDTGGTIISDEMRANIRRGLRQKEQDWSNHDLLERMLSGRHGENRRTFSRSELESQLPSRDVNQTVYHGYQANEGNAMKPRGNRPGSALFVSAYPDVSTHYSVPDVAPDINPSGAYLASLDPKKLEEKGPAGPWTARMSLDTRSGPNKWLAHFMNATKIGRPLGAMVSDPAPHMTAPDFERVMTAPEDFSDIAKEIYKHIGQDKFMRVLQRQGNEAEHFAKGSSGGLISKAWKFGKETYGQIEDLMPPGLTPGTLLLSLASMLPGGKELKSDMLPFNQGGQSMPVAMKTAELYGKLRPEIKLDKPPPSGAIHRDAGGEIPQVPGIGADEDEVTIKAKAGEQVIKKPQAEKFRGLLNDINDDRIPAGSTFTQAGGGQHFAEGGTVNQEDIADKIKRQNAEAKALMEKWISESGPTPEWKEWQKQAAKSGPRIPTAEFAPPVAKELAPSGSTGRLLAGGSAAQDVPMGIRADDVPWATPAPERKKFGLGGGIGDLGRELTHYAMGIPFSRHSSGRGGFAPDEPDRGDRGESSNAEMVGVLEDILKELKEITKDSHEKKKAEAQQPGLRPNGDFVPLGPRGGKRGIGSFSETPITPGDRAEVQARAHG